MKILNVGDRVEAGSYRRHSCFRQVTNYAREAGPAALLCLVAPPVGAGPIHIVIGGPLPDAEALSVEPGILRIGAEGHALDTAPRFDSSLPKAPVRRDLAESLAAHLVARAHPKSLAFLVDPARVSAFREGFERNLVRRVQDGAEQLLGGDPARGFMLLRGCGFGLTPAGDDLLAGAWIGMKLAGTPFGPPAGSQPPVGKNVLSDTFLALAAEGRVNEAMKNLLAALGGDSPDRVREAADRVLAHGETSGADVLTGLVLGMQKGTNAQQPTSHFQRRTGGPHDRSR